MAKEEAAACTPLRRTIAGVLEERGGGARCPVTLIALASTALRFLAHRSFPAGTSCTVRVDRAPRFELELTVVASALLERDVFACDAVIRRTHRIDREHFDALLRRLNVA